MLVFTTPDAPQAHAALKARPRSEVPYIGVVVAPTSSSVELAVADFGEGYVVSIFCIEEGEVKGGRKSGLTIYFCP